MPLARPHVRPLALLGLAGTLFAAGCGAPDAPLAPTAPTSGAVRSVAAAVPRLLECPTTDARSTTALIGLLGGLLDLGNHRVNVPFGAVLDAQLFSLAVVPGRHMAIDVHAVSLTSFLFRRTITVTIDYSRCGDVSGPLTVWHVDATTGALLENMGGVTDPVRRTITFQTPHLSIYAVAN